VRYEAASEDDTMKNLVEAHRFRALTPELRASCFGETPEYVRWGALDCWTIDEAVLLTIGLDPKVDLFSERRDVFAPGKSSSEEQALHALKMTREQAWKQISDFGYPTDPIMGFDEETEEVLRKWTFTDVAAEFIQLHDRIERAIEVGRLGEKIVPAAYIIWATNSNISLPNELIRVVKSRTEIPDWKAQCEAVSQECDVLKRELEELRSRQEKKQDLGPKERLTVKRLIIGMAVQGYKYNPKADRNSAPKEIADDLESLGISLDVDTVRKWLKESAEELPSDWQPG
jgi:hypothetical protein